MSLRKSLLKKKFKNKQTMVCKQENQWATINSVQDILILREKKNEIIGSELITEKCKKYKEKLTQRLFCPIFKLILCGKQLH